MEYRDSEVEDAYQVRAGLRISPPRGRHRLASKNIYCPSDRRPLPVLRRGIDRRVRMVERSMTKLSIAQRLRAAREHAGLSQGQVALLLQLHRPPSANLKRAEGVSARRS